MKRKIVGILVTGMIMTSLTGCGAEAEATNATPDSSETIIANEKEEVTVGPENSNEEMTTETVMEESNVETEDFTGAENSSIVLYAEIADRGDYLPQKDQTFETETITITAYEDIPIYNGDSIKVGYVKNGATVTITEYAVETYWARFENPIKEADYDYLYIPRNYIDNSQKVENMLTVEEMKERVIEELYQRGEDNEVTILDAPESDMEVYECRISKEGDVGMLNMRMDEAFQNPDTFCVIDYHTYYLECEDDGEYVICRLYYKDANEWVE